MEIDGLYKFCLIFFWEEFETEANAMADQAQWHYGVYWEALRGNSEPAELESGLRHGLRHGLRKSWVEPQSF